MIAVSSRTQQSKQSIHQDGVQYNDSNQIEDVAGVNISHGVGLLVD